MDSPRHPMFARALVCPMLITSFLLLCLVGCGTASVATASTPTAVPTATSALDAQSQAYWDVLHTYYALRFSKDKAPDTICTFDRYKAAVPGAKASALQACLAPNQAVVTDAQALLDHLAATSPPARWQTIDSGLKQALQNTTAIYTQRIAAIQAGSTSQFDATIDPGVHSWDPYCDLITQVNASLPAPFALPALC